MDDEEAGLTFVAPADDPHTNGRAMYAATPDGHVLRAFFPHPGAEPEFHLSRRLPGDGGDYHDRPPENADWKPMTSADLRRYGLAD